MKKNLAKRIVLGLLTGAVLMSSSVAWAGIDVYQTTSNGGVYEGSLTVGDSGIPTGADAQYATVVGIGAYTSGSNSVVLGFGSSTEQTCVVSVGHGKQGDSSIITLNGQTYEVPNTRRIVNVAKGLSDNDAVNVGQLREALTGAFRDVEVLAYQTYENAAYDDYAVSVGTLKNVLDEVIVAGGNVVETEEITDGGSKTEIGGFSVQESASGSVTLGTSSSAVVTFEQDKVVFGKNSSWYEEEEGFFAGSNNGTHDIASAKAALKEDGGLMGASGKFIVDGNTGNVTAANLYISDTSGIIDVKTKLGEKADKATTLAGYGITDAYTKGEVNTELGKKADQSALTQEVADRQAADQNLQSQIDQIGSEAISGINQRLGKLSGKLNKVGAGAAALAALHPLDYDPDDKLTFSAGMGNYAGENAAALGAFYRPNEKFMLSLGGTMGNGENMVNLGLSIGLDKASGFAKMSKRELIQEVNAVKAENEAMKAEMAEMKAMLQELLAKK